jgi:hypothetical protein
VQAALRIFVGLFRGVCVLIALAHIALGTRAIPGRAFVIGRARPPRERRTIDRASRPASLKPNRPPLWKSFSGMLGRSWMQQGLTATCKDRGSELRQSETEDPALAHEPVGAMRAG